MFLQMFCTGLRVKYNTKHIAKLFFENVLTRDHSLSVHTWQQCVVYTAFTFNEESELVGDNWLNEVVEMTNIYASVTPRTGFNL